MFRHLLLLISLWFVPAAAALGQSAGAIHGQVTDESGALVPGAKVLARGADGTAKAAVTGNDGSYALTGLPPGRYNIQAAAAGLTQFQPAVAEVGVGVVTLNLQLRVVLEKQEVTVQENPGPTVSTDPSNNAGALVLRGEDLQALSDDPDDLQADLQALAGPAAGPNGGQIYIDGFTGGQLPNKDSIREVRINQNPFSPEYDKLGFGRIEIFTKPGTDKFRGQAYFNYGNDIFNTRNPYAQQKAPFDLKEFGGNLSGPLGRRASFFVDVDRRMIDNGAVIDAITLDPATLLPNPFTQVFLTPFRRTRISPRADYQINSSNTLTVRYGYTRNDIQDSGVGNFNLATRGVNSTTADHTVQVTETAVLNTRVINETRFQYFHISTGQTGNSGLPSLNVLSAFNGGGSQIGNASDRENRYELQNYTSIAAGVHSWKFGIRVRGVSIDSLAPNNFGGTFSFGGGVAPKLNANNQPIVPGSQCVAVRGGPVVVIAIPDVCQNITSIERYRRTLLFQQAGLTPAQIRLLGGGATQFSLNAGNPFASVGQADIGAFAGDDWRARPNLTLSLGLRYETQTNVHDWSDFAPRIGFAWAPGQSAKGAGRPKTVVRGGFGVFYDRFSENNVLTAERFNGVTEQQYTVVNPDFFPNVPSPAALQQNARGQTVHEISNSLRAPYIVQSAIGVERQLPKNTTVAVTYTNSHGVHMLRSRDINAPLPGTYTGEPGSGAYPYGNIGPVFLVESAGTYNQNQLITNVNSRLTKDISLFGFYMLNFARSNTDGVGTFPANQYDLTGEYGPAAQDVRNRGFIGGSIGAKWNLRLSPFIVVQSGAPFDITSGTDQFGSTLFTGRPGIAANAFKPGVVITPYGLLDPNPSPGERILPRNFGRGPGQFTVNLRLAKTFGFGALKEGAGGGGGGDFGGGRPHGPGGGGPGGGAMHMGGGMGGFGGGSTNRRYNLTLSVSARNLFNHVNPGPIIGNVSSPLFGQANQIAGGFGAFSENANNRRLELQMRFTF